MSNIDHITELESRNYYNLKVYYKNGRVFEYKKNDSLPNTVLNLYLNGTAETNYLNGTAETVRVTTIR